MPRNAPACAGGPRVTPAGRGDGGSAPSVGLGGPLAPARFVERPNRFVVRCRIAGPPGREDAVAGEAGPATFTREAAGIGGNPRAAGGEVVEAHLPDPGRLEELLVPGRRLLLRPAARPGRRTDWTVLLVRAPDAGPWVSVDTTLPNRLVEKALRSGFVEELRGWALEATEVRLGGSRLDFVLARGGGRRLALEVKSVTLVVDRTARFPDAVTARGARHVRELAELAGRDGWASAVLFVAQRPDVDRIVADGETDPEFARALEAAREAGVRCLGRRCHVTRQRVRMGVSVPVG